MANQDPQPEIYTTRHDVAASSAAGTTNTVTVYTNQANNEEVRIYAIAVSNHRFHGCFRYHGHRFRGFPSGRS